MQLHANRTPSVIFAEYSSRIFYRLSFRADEFAMTQPEAVVFFFVRRRSNKESVIKIANHRHYKIKLDDR